MRIIATGDLQQTDLPRKNAPWVKIVAFASTFDPRSEESSVPCPAGVSQIDQSASLFELRGALYSEWRRWNHFHQSPDSSTMLEIWKTIEMIRSSLGRAF